jgi:hypothetical protein
LATRSAGLVGRRCYGEDRAEAVAKVQALALRVIAGRVSCTAKRRKMRERHVRDRVSNSRVVAH